MRMPFQHPFEGVDLGSAIQSVKEELAPRAVDRTSETSLIGAINSTIEYESKLRYSRLLKALELAQRLGVPSTVEVRKTAGWVLLICFFFAFGYGSTPVESPRILALLLVLIPGFTWVLTGYSKYRSVGADLSVASGAGLFLGLVAARALRPDDPALRYVLVGVWFVGFLFTLIQGLDCGSQYSAKDFEELRRGQEQRRAFGERIRYVSELPEEEQEEKAQELFLEWSKSFDALMSEVNRPWWLTSPARFLYPIRMWPIWLWVFTIPFVFRSFQ